MAQPQKPARNTPSVTQRDIDQPTIEYDSQSKEPISKPNREQETVASQNASDSTVSKPKGKLGNYRIVDEIARGGMGVVYRVRQEEADRIVALKLIRGADPSSKEVERFQAEARAAAKLDHPGIVPIYDVDFIAGSPFFTMKYIAGPSLSARISGTPLEPTLAAKLIHRVADAIEHAHANGIIHRDLKPGNILLEDDHHPMVTDFGLAKLSSSDSDLTRSGEAIGTPAYMPPEQAAGDRLSIDQRSDVYSLGAVLYACLTGRPPFQGQSAMATIIQVTRDEPLPPKALNPDVPVDLDVICLKCLEKDPTKRYQTAAELRDELERFNNSQPIMARPASALEKAWKWTTRNRLATAAIAAGAVALAAISVGAVYAVYSSRLVTELERTLVAEANASSESKRANDALEVAEDAIVQKEHAEYYNQVALAQLAYQQDNIMAFSSLLFGSKPAYRGWEYNYLENLFFAPERPLRLAKGVTNSAMVSDDGKILALAPSQREITFVDYETSSVLWSIPFSDNQFELLEIELSPAFDEMLTVENQGSKTVANRISHFRLSQAERSAELVARIETIPRVTLVADWSKRKALLQADFRRQDLELQVLSLDNGLSISKAPSPVRPMACEFSLDGDWLFASGFSSNKTDGLLCKFSTKDWKVVERTAIEGHEAMQLTVSPHANSLVVSSERTVASYDADSLTMLDRASPMDSRILGLDFSPDGSKLAVSTYSGRVDVLETNGMEISSKLRGQSWPAFRALFPKADNSLLSVSQNGDVLRWKLDGTAHQAPLPTHKGKVKRISISPDESIVASCGVVVNGGPAIMLTDLKTGQQLTSVLRHDAPIQEQFVNASWMQFINGGRSLLVATYDYSLKFLDPRTGEITKTMDLDNDMGLWDAALSKDEQWLATAGLDNTVRRFNVATGEMTHCYKSEDSGFWSVEISDDGSEIYATASQPDNLFAFSLQAFDKPTVYRNLTDAPRVSTFIPSRSEVVFGGIAGHVARVNTQTKETSKPGYSETKLITAIEVHPNGNRLVTCSDQGTVTLRETLHLAPVLTLTGHQAAATAAAFSPSGKYLVTGDLDGNLIIWDGR